VVGFDQQRGDALAVVQVAVVGIDGALHAAVGQAVERGVWLVDAIEAAGGESGIEAALDVAPLEEERVGGVGQREAQDKGGGGETQSAGDD
jgi:hypothetical protein